MREVLLASAWSHLIAQFKDVLIVILLIPAALSAGLGHEAVAIAVIVLVPVLLGFVQEFRAEKSLVALQQMAAPTETAIRDGREAEVPAWGCSRVS